MRKAILPAISVILLIMLVVAITGGAWYWLSGMTEEYEKRNGDSIPDCYQEEVGQFVCVFCKTPSRTFYDVEICESR